MHAPRREDVLADWGRALERAGWPMRQLRAALPELLTASGELPGPGRCFWLSGLRRAWKAQGWSLDAQGRRDLLTLAAVWRDHPLALVLGDELERRGELDAAAALGSIAAHHAQGDAEAALTLAWRWQLLAPRDHRFAAAYRELSDWLAWREGRPRFPADDLRLEPLGHQHLSDFAWQYHAADIRELCRMPAFHDDARWHAWLDDLYRIGDEWCLAILHADWGFVGCVHLVWVGNIGFLYYWLGPDFRGQGLARRAAELLLEGAAPSLRVCYAKVFERNALSRRLLERLGFVELDIRAAPLDEEECFYRLGEPAPRARMVEELHELMMRMHSDTRVAAPLMIGGGA